MVREEAGNSHAALCYPSQRAKRNRIYRGSVFCHIGPPFAMSKQNIQIRTALVHGKFNSNGVRGLVKAPSDLEHSYRVRFPNGVEEPLKPTELTLLAKFKEGEIGNSKRFKRGSFRCTVSQTVCITSKAASYSPSILRRPALSTHPSHIASWNARSAPRSASQSFPDMLNACAASVMRYFSGSFQLPPSPSSGLAYRLSVALDVHRIRCCAQCSSGHAYATLVLGVVWLNMADLPKPLEPTAEKFSTLLADNLL